MSNFLKPLLTTAAMTVFAVACPVVAAQDNTPDQTLVVEAPAESSALAAGEGTTEALNVEAETTPQDSLDAESEDITVAEASVDYSMMNIFMEKLSVNERGRPAIAYKVVRESALPALDEYEAILTSVDESNLNDDDRLAYWLNLQNFLVVKAITTDTKKTNLKSARGSGKKPGKLWTKERITLDGKTYSIADVEAKITSEFKDPNVIYGLYQGVRGGPCLSDVAYEGATVRTYLVELGMRYVNSRGIVSPEKGTVTITPVYDWHKEALFQGDNNAILKHVKSHANTALRGRLNRGRDVEFTKLNYTADNYIVPKGTKAAATPRRQAPRPQTPRTQQRPRGGGGGGGGSYGS